MTALGEKIDSNTTQVNGALPPPPVGMYQFEPKVITGYKMYVIVKRPMMGDESTPLFWSNEGGWGCDESSVMLLDHKTPEHLPIESCGLIDLARARAIPKRKLVTLRDIRAAKIEIMAAVNSTAYEDSLDSAEAMGALARLKGISRDANPFRGKGADEYFMWDVGWVEEDDSKAK